jgi:hypothetical protein
MSALKIARRIVLRVKRAPSPLRHRLYNPLPHLGHHLGGEEAHRALGVGAGDGVEIDLKRGDLDAIEALLVIGDLAEDRLGRADPGAAPFATWLSKDSPALFDTLLGVSEDERRARALRRGLCRDPPLGRLHRHSGHTQRFVHILIYAY